MRIETTTTYIADDGTEFDNETDCRNHEQNKSKYPIWIVNELGELGVRIEGQNYYLYKGENYQASEHEDGRPLQWRRVEKREFGELSPFAISKGQFQPVHLGAVQILLEGVQ